MNVGSDRVFTRFIPAGAGNTASAAALRNRETVYLAGAGNTLNRDDQQSYFRFISADAGTRQ